VTTTSVALAAVWPRPVLLAECDPAGGDLVYRLPAGDGSRLDPRRGLLSLAVAARRGLEPRQVWEHTQKLRGGLDVLVGVTNAEQGTGLDPLWGQIGAGLSGMPDADVIADCGRVGTEGRYYDLLARADAVVLITRASLGDMVRIRDRVSVVDAALRRRGGPGRVSVLVIANYKSFSAALDEVKQVLSGGNWPAPVLGGIAYEPRSAELLSGEWGGKLDKSLLIRTARAVAGELSGQLPAPAGSTGDRLVATRPAPAAPPAPPAPAVAAAPPVAAAPAPVPQAASELRQDTPSWLPAGAGRDGGVRREPDIVRPPDPGRSADPARGQGSERWPQQRPLNQLPPGHQTAPGRQPAEPAPLTPLPSAPPGGPARQPADSGPLTPLPSAPPGRQPIEPPPAGPAAQSPPRGIPSPPTLPYQRPAAPPENGAGGPPRQASRQPLRAVPELPGPGHSDQGYAPRDGYPERTFVNREGYAERDDYPAPARRDYPRDDVYPAPTEPAEESDQPSDLIPGLRRGPSAGDGGRPGGRGRHAGGGSGSVPAEPGRR
jgi:hypothetical protein